MPDTLPALTVRKSLTVEASIAHSFHVFTTGFDSWWPRAHHIGKADLLAAVIEPRAGGRWFEKGIDGSGSYCHSPFKCHESTTREGGSYASTVPHSHSEPSTPFSYQRPPAFGSITAASRSALPM